MRRRSEAEIQAAINECLSSCRQSENRLSVLMEYILKLKAQQWDTEDIRIAQAAVVRILAELVTSKESLVPTRSRVDNKSTRQIELFLVNMDSLRSRS